MNTLPPHLAILLLLGIFGFAVAAYLYWNREPVRAQAAACRVLTPVWRVIKALYLVTRWVVTLLIAYAMLIALTLPHLAMALAWVTLKKVAGEKATVTVKLT